MKPTFILPVVMMALGLLTGMVQACILFIPATVYIAAVTRTRQGESESEAESND